MGLAKTYTAQVSGIEAKIITIEADISNGLHSFSIVGLGDRAVEESKDRVSSAIKNSGYISPKQKNQKVVVSLAPADLRKEGPVFDVGVALAYLAATREISFDPEKKLFLGELSLEGKIRPINGILAMTQAAKKENFQEIYIPKENAREASLISGIKIYPADSLGQIIRHLSGTEKILFLVSTNAIQDVFETEKSHNASDMPDFADIIGQENAKRALEIAATGRHNIVMYGPPGTGKTMLAKALANVLPPLTHEESISVTTVHSIAKSLKGKIIIRPPFRAPHHTSSYASIVGGGGSVRPGEITLAHKGILFLDEFVEFDRRVIDALRQPLEDRAITVTRTKESIKYPADCIFVAAMNPCSCGNLYSNDQSKKCICTDNEIRRYKKKISGPIADRIDIWIPVLKVDPKRFSETTLNNSARQKKVLSSVEIRERIIKAQKFRKDIVAPAKISDEVRSTLLLFSKKLNLSGRGHYRTIAVARTIADLDESKEIKKKHILEALQYRQRDF